MATSRPEDAALPAGPGLTRLLAAFFENVLDGVLLIRPGGAVLRANPAACAMLGRTEAELQALGCAEIVASSAEDSALLPCDRDRRTRGELTFRRSDGSTFRAEVTCSSFLDEGGARYGAIAFRDLTERRVAEAALRAAEQRAESSEERLRVVADHSRDVIWALDLAPLRFTYVSPAILELCGFTPEEVMARPLDALLTPESLARARAVIAKLGTPAEEDPHVAVYDHRCKDGAVKHVEITVSLLRDEAGRPRAALGISRDATERVRAERALRESEALYRSLFTLAPSGVVLADVTGRIVAFNDRAAAQLGYAREEFSGLALRDIDADADGVPVEARVEKVLAEERLEFETRHRARSGELRDVHVKAVRVDAGGAPALLCVWDDVTEARRMARELRLRLAERDEGERWLQASQRVARLGHYVFEITEDRWTSSAVLDEILGIGPDYPRTAAGWIALVHEEDREEMRAYLGELIASGERFDREYRVGRDGEVPRWVHGLGDLERDGAGRPVRLVGTIQDASARRAADLARETLAEQLRQAQKLESIGRLAGGVAHDFNNILLVILTCADSLQQRLEAGLPPEAEDVQEIQAAAQRAKELTGQLLAFARKQVVAPVVLDLNEVVVRAERLLNRVIGEDVELSLRLQPGPCTVTCDPGQLQQVLMNLAVNARDAMPRGGQLTLSTGVVERVGAAEDGWYGAAAPPGRYVRLLVEDTGTGIPPDLRPRIFEPFFTTKPQGKGTGLGLATAYGIVQQSGGAIRFHSEVGRGTAFELLWPCSAHRTASAATAERPREPARPAPRPSERLLLVEDDDLVREATTRALRRAGYEVVAAAGGTEALAFLGSGGAPPHLLLTDVVMRGMNGRQVAEAVRRVCPSIRVLFMSGYAQDIIVHHGVVEPGLDLLVKPFTHTVLLERVRAALAR